MREKREERKKKKGKMKTRSFISVRNFLAFFSFIFSLLFFLSSCELFDTLPEEVLQAKIEENVQWANAARLSITVAIPSGWGESPQSGPGRCFDKARTNEKPRKGYPFTVEFTPAGGFGFFAWLAFNSDAYTLAQITAWDINTAQENSLKNTDGVVFSALSYTNTGAVIVTVTVNAAVPVMLVPFCDTRPRLNNQTNPPLSGMQAPFPYDQNVNIWFTMPIQAETVQENIKISAVHTNDQNIFGKDRGDPFGEDGDITNYFKIDIFPGGHNNRVDLIPINTADYPSIHLAFLGIIVAVGPGIQSANDIAMGETELISYQTNISKMQKAYRPGMIQASRKEDNGYFWDAAAQWNNPDIDRRFNDKPGSNTVYLKFSVTPPQEAASMTPNRIIIVERLVYKLDGSETSGAANHEYQMTSGDFSADGGCIIAHTLKTTEPGIMQLVVLPAYNGAQGLVEPLDINAAIAEGHYVTVVLDNAAPGGSLSSLGAEITNEAGEIAKTFRSDGSMTFTFTNIENVNDNEGLGGILHDSDSAYRKPWTMDEWENLTWGIRIVGDQNQVYAGPYENDVLTNSYTINNFNDLPKDTELKVEVSFCDTIGNTAWLLLDTITIIDAAPVPVTKLEAVVNGDGNRITIRWKTEQNDKNNMTGARVFINNEEQTPESGVGDRTRYINCPIIDTSVVRKGQVVNNVHRYDIRVTGYNIAGNAEPMELSIWNIPDMNVTQTDLTTTNTEYLTQANIADKLKAAGSYGKNFMLTEDVTLTSWEPVGTGTIDPNDPNIIATAFQGKFYGNGHTITINSMNTAANMGLFGTVQRAEIRDLRVEYAMTADGNGNFGGIAGEVFNLPLTTGTQYTYIRNVIVDGSLTINGSGEIYAGGIAGRNESTITNSVFQGNITVKHTGGNNVTMGGLFGSVSNNNVADCEYLAGGVINLERTGGPSSIGGFAGSIYRSSLNNCASRGLIKIVYQTGLDTIRAGGFTGEIFGKITGCYSASPIEITINSDTTGVYNGQFHSIGGFGGIMSNVEVDIGFIIVIEDGYATQCYSTGSITILSTGNEFFDYYVGGFTGPIRGKVKLENCYATGNVMVDRSYPGGEGNTHVGGFAGGMEVTGGSIIRCFSTGSVVGRSSRSAIGSAGGVVAYVENGPNTISNSVALGSSVTGITGGVSSDLHTGRISANGNFGTRTNNYAIDTLKVYRQASDSPFGEMSVTSNDDTSENGSTIQRVALTPSFWRNTLGFSDTVWDMGTPVTRKGYPTLRGVGGQE